MTVRFTAIPTEIARHAREGHPDAYGLAPERGQTSTGSGTPCRHCLRQVPVGEAYLILAHRPFQGLNPYTETGPIFLWAADCPRGDSASLPRTVLTAPHYIVRGYSAQERIVYGSGGVLPTEDIPVRCAALLADPAIAFVHIRSAANNCFLLRAERSDGA